jgi:pimeloyl-ACP methyl ester carboxylesterase
MTFEERFEPTEGYLDVPGGRLHYLDWGGSGHQAHFLHGNGFCAGTYAPFLRHLVKELRIIASDVRGHGGSDFLGIRRVRSWKVFAEDLRAIVAATSRPPIIGMGHSLGAVATGIAAATFAELFSAVVLVDPVLPMPRRLAMMAGMRALGLEGLLPRARAARRRRKSFRSKAEALTRFLSGRGIFTTWSPEFVEAYLECGLLEKDSDSAVLTCDPELEAQIFESIPLQAWGYMRRIRCPVLAIRGGRSDVFLAEAADRLRRTAPDAEVVTIPGTGHFPTMEKPKECAQAIREFLRRRIH